METIVSRTLSVHKEHEVLLKLEAAGLCDELAQKVVDSKDNDLAKKVVRLIQNGGFEPSTSQKRAREIMDKNLFGVEEAIAHFGVNPSKQQSAYLAEIPFAESVLEACKNTHILVAVFPMALLDIRGACKDQSLFYNQDWYNKQAFAKEKGEVGWQLIRKTPIDDSTSKTWDEQNKLLGKDDEVPTVRAVVYTMIGHYKAIGERLFEKIWVRCSDLDSVGHRVLVGYFDAEGLNVSYYWDAYRYDNLGLASARK
jgi:hypothetical protein